MRALPSPPRLGAFVLEGFGLWFIALSFGAEAFSEVGCGALAWWPYRDYTMCDGRCLGERRKVKAAYLLRFFPLLAVTSENVTADFAGVWLQKTWVVLALCKQPPMTSLSFSSLPQVICSL